MFSFLVKYLVLCNLWFYTQLLAQNYYESLGDYNVELIAEKNKTSKVFEDYECSLNIYDNNKQLISDHYLNDNNGYEMKKFIINKNVNEEAIFVLTNVKGANSIWGDLICIKFKNFNTSNGIISVPILIFYDNMSLDIISEEPKLNDIIKDLDGDGIIEILDGRWILLGTTGRITGGVIQLILHLDDEKFINVNNMFYDYLVNDIERTKSNIIQSNFNCKNKDEFAINTYQNNIASIVISYILLNKSEEGFKYFDTNYKCENVNLLKTKIISYYFEMNRFNYGRY